MGNKNFGTKKVNYLPITLVLFACIVTVTLAFFFGSDWASGFFKLSGKVDIEAVGKGDTYSSIEDRGSVSNLKIELDRDYPNLIPNMPIRIDVNCKVKKSSTKPLLRAKFSLEILEKDTDNQFQEPEGKNIFEDLNNQLKTTITNNSNWYLFSDGFYYYIESFDETNAGDSFLKEIDATSGDVIVPFIAESITFSKEADNTYSGLEINISITFQAIQNFIPDDNGVELPKTITNSQKIFSDFT